MPAASPRRTTLVREEVSGAIDRGSREFDLGHTWDGAPLPSAVGLAVLDQIDERGLVDRVRERGPALRDEFASAIEGSGLVKEVRGRDFLLGVELVRLGIALGREGAIFHVLSLCGRAETIGAGALEPRCKATRFTPFAP